MFCKISYTKYLTSLTFYRDLVWFDMFLTNIDKSHPGAKELLMKGDIAVARSLMPGALSAVDKTMEETFMKFSKSDLLKYYLKCFGVKRDAYIILGLNKHVTVIKKVTVKFHLVQ